MELANAIDAKRRERGEPESIIVWENVPGVLSSKDNAFGCFLAGLAGESCELQPAGGNGRTQVVCLDQKGYRGASLMLNFSGGPTTPPCVRCRKCSKRIRSRSGTFELDSVRRDSAPRRETQRLLPPLLHEALERVAQTTIRHKLDT